MVNSGNKEMAGYRVYLFEENARICVGQYHFAANATEAEKIEAALNDACSDTFGDFEVWDGEGCIATVHKDGPRPGGA
jgi:hypothetical protein